MPRPGMLFLVLALWLLALPAGPQAFAADDPPRHGLAMYGEPKYPPGFDHFAYVNPDAPKGGSVVLSALGGFDTLNPFTIRGVAAAGIANTFDTLMVESLDEPFTQYPLVAESVELPEDRAWVAFTLRHEARFHDGEPIGVEDVIFTFDTLREAHPFYRAYYANVAKVERTGERTVRFTFAPGDNRELPLILGQLPVLPKHYWEGRTFDQTTLEPPLGSGPYRIARVDPGRSITYERVSDYWGRDLAVNTGRFNFGTMRYDYYLDPTVALQAFNGGLVDFRVENIAKNWATAYDRQAVEAGRIRKEEIEVETPAGMQGFVFNTRRPVFADPRVRYAIAHAFDFEWANSVLFYGAYQRADSYFENSDLESEGLPGEAEMKLLEPLRGRIPDEVFTERYSPPSAGSRTAVRENLLKARELLEEAGWVVRDGRRVNAETGRPLEFTILLNSPSMERVALPFVANLRRLGIDARVRTVDTAQYQNRISDFDFDMTTAVWGQSLSPGNEQRDFWTSAAADRPGSRNYAGIRSEAVDQLVDLLIAADTREDLRARAAALDRVLLWGHYVIPHWYAGVARVAYWEKLEHPRDLPPYGIAFDAWWVKGASAGR
ncbi:extracellular solute-binding protein [Skermanella mucosa]|uniref:extracellular solute-binding protein n=1 Tax=Skermanella mucosa TaxID=1789672 RepID=UPI00192B6D4F|nr:extracellular solute-binding protein [Skermanella mucosa]UEM19855.1 extracellular solute-binding protein [Skermanella mucosa]